MKSWLQTKLKRILKWLSIKTIAKYQPGVIGITGSVGKTSTKEAVYTVLRGSRRVRASFGNLNNELGLPLAILGDWQKPTGASFWLKVIWQGWRNLIFRTDYPEILILEYAADKPEDLDYLLSIARPQIGIVTAIGEIPAHSEFYNGPEEVTKEKSKLIKYLPPSGFAVLNFDDDAVFSMKENIRASLFTYGFGQGAQMRITNFENRSDEGRPLGITFKLSYGENFVPVRIDGVLGKAQAYAAAAAACVGLGFSMNLVRIAEALAYYKTPVHRMKFLMGVKETYIIDDCYNASPMSMRAAMEAIKDFSAKRKVGILGDMLELGQYTNEAHEAVGQMAAKSFNFLITVGPHAKFVATAALKKGMSSEKIRSFDSVDELVIEVLGLLKQGDLVLVKASRGMRLDRVVEEISHL